MTGVKAIAAALLLAGLFFGTAVRADTARTSFQGISANQNNAAASVPAYGCRHGYNCGVS